MKRLLGAVKATGGLLRPSVPLRPLMVRCYSSSAATEASPLPLIKPSLRTWEDFRDLGAVVVDKTMETAAMLRPGEENFLARPRKSGKSLSLSTANAILSAKTELLEGTKLMMAVENGDPTVAHVAQLWDKGGVPVLHFDFCAVRARPDVFEEDLLQLLLCAAETDLSIQLSSNSTPLALRELFQALRKRGRKVAVLIDEYDQPIVKMLSENGGKMDENVDSNIRVLHEFFTALKSAFALNGYCLFMTGVSKFSRVSLFSGANTITDLSFEPEHQKAFHFSWEEIVETYPRHLEALLDLREEGTMEELRQTLEKCYGGYSFSPQALDRDSRLFNPFDVACVLAKPEKCPPTGNLPDFWCRQGRMGWLAKHLDAGFIRQGLWSSAQSIDASSSLVNLEVKHLGKRPAATASLLQQTGYLAFDEYQEGGERPTVTLRPANQLTQEVLQRELLEKILLAPEAGIAKP